MVSIFPLHRYECILYMHSLLQIYWELFAPRKILKKNICEKKKIVGKTLKVQNGPPFIEVLYLRLLTLGMASFVSTCDCIIVVYLTSLVYNNSDSVPVYFKRYRLRHYGTPLFYVCGDRSFDAKNFNENHGFSKIITIVLYIKYASNVLL